MVFDWIILGVLLIVVVVDFLCIKALFKMVSNLSVLAVYQHQYLSGKYEDFYPQKKD